MDEQNDLVPNKVSERRKFLGSVLAGLGLAALAPSKLFGQSLLLRTWAQDSPQLPPGTYTATYSQTYTWTISATHENWTRSYVNPSIPDGATINTWIDNGVLTWAYTYVTVFMNQTVTVHETKSVVKQPTGGKTEVARTRSAVGGSVSETMSLTPSSYSMTRHGTQISTVVYTGATDDEEFAPLCAGALPEREPEAIGCLDIDLDLCDPRTREGILMTLPMAGAR